MGDPPLFLTGFGAFEGVEENPSGALARTLHGERGVAGVELPVSFLGAATAFDAGLARLSPDGVAALVSLGVHPGAGFRLERRARATLGTDRPDSDGDTGEVVSGRMGGGAGDLATSLELLPLQGALSALSIGPVRVSEDAGGYVCERIYRHGLVRAGELGIPALFLHVPPLADIGFEDQLLVVRGLLDELRNIVAL